MNGEPFLTDQLRRLHAAGIRDVVMCIGHLGQAIETYAGDGSRFGLRVQYAYDAAARNRRRHSSRGSAARRQLFDDVRRIDYGLGAFKRAAFERIPSDEPYDLGTLYGDLLREGPACRIRSHRTLLRDRLEVRIATPTPARISRQTGEQLNAAVSS